jgi:phosphoglycolate phosphatase-like HAD superfamily hydrolase
MPLLVLFDVDGTLFLTHDALSGQALRKTLEAHFRVDLPEDAIERVPHPGQTSLKIARLVLHDAGLDDHALDAGLQAWCPEFAARYLELLGHADTSTWEAAPGAVASLSRLQAAGLRLALWTGNPEPMARARMKLLGLDVYFPEGQGAFGCDSESRSELLDLARERAGGWPAAETVAVGDTKRDVEAARATGIRSIAVRPEGSDDGFPGADAVCGDLDEVSSRLLSWAGPPADRG